MARAIELTDRNVDIVFLINEGLVGLIEITGFKFITNDDLNKDIKIVENSNTDLFIFDSYLGDNKYLNDIKGKTTLMLIDDNNDIYDSSIPHIIYNGNIHAKKLGYRYIEGQTRLLGPQYLIMKEEYWNSSTNMNLNKDGILITTGGTDEYGIALDIINTIRQLNTKIRVIIGPGYRDEYIREIEGVKTGNIELIYKPSSLKEYINFSKIVITAGGSTVYEVLSQGSMPIIFGMADNQDMVCKALQELGVPYLGKYPNIDYSGLKELVETLYNEKIDKKKKIFDFIDGKGALVTAKILLSSANTANRGRQTAK